MGFLSKIKKYLSRGHDKEFRKQVLSEKKQKYLFSDSTTDKYRSSRSGFLIQKKRAIAPYANSFGMNLEKVQKTIKDSKILAFMGLFLIFLSGYVVFFSPYFRVSPSHVLIEARNDGIDINVAYRAIEEIYGKSLFLLDEEELGQILKQSLKNLSNLTIDKLYPNGVKVLMTSTPITYHARILGFDREWRMSNNGVLIPKLPNTASGTLSTTPVEIISVSLRGEVFFDYKQVISDERMLIMNRIIEIFGTEWPDLKIEKIRYFDQENEVHLMLTGNTQILMTLEAEGNRDNYQSRIENTKDQLTGLKTYIETHPGELSDSSITYIDARIVKKIFVCKPRETCTNNLITIYGETYR